MNPSNRKWARDPVIPKNGIDVQPIGDELRQDVRSPYYEAKTTFRLITGPSQETSGVLPDRACKRRAASPPSEAFMPRLRAPREKVSAGAHVPSCARDAASDGDGGGQPTCTTVVLPSLRCGKWVNTRIMRRAAASCALSHYWPWPGLPVALRAAAGAAVAAVAVADNPPTAPLICIVWLRALLPGIRGTLGTVLSRGSNQPLVSLFVPFSQTRVMHVHPITTT
ncbi:Protein of unknown function, partial [Gryllus bimaculatus]